MSTNRTDTALVAALRDGDETAFDAIYQRYAAELRIYARRLLGAARHDAEDVVQDAFIRALASLRSTDRPMTLRPWLYAIVRNRALDELRRPHRRHLADRLEPIEIAELSAVGDPHDALLRREALDGVLTAINALPPRQRLALVLRELGDHSHDEVAATLGVSRGASKTLVHRAKTALALAA